MALATVGGAALGAVFGALLDGVIAVATRAIMFKSHLRNLKFTLDSFQDVVDDIEQHNNVAFRRVPGVDKFIIQMEKGLQLVVKCSKVRPWKLNAFKKPLYTNKLLALDATLKVLLSVLAVHVANDVRARVINMATDVIRIDGNIVAQSQNQNQNQNRGWCAVPEPPDFTVGLNVPLKELKIKLLRDDASMLVVTAPGGMGKTTLAEMFCQDEEVKAKFDKNIVFVTALRRPNYVIVQELCKQTRSQVPAFQDEANAFNWLQEFLRESGQNPLLLVLDDVWPGSESLLDKCNEFKRSNYKILVTSRSQFPRFGSYSLHTLKHEDAMDLFCHAATPPDGSSIPVVFAKQIVESCRGFPLAITVVGRSLCGQPITIWEKTVMDRKNATVNDLLDCLQRSLDALDRNMAAVRECFIDLGSFPEDQRIPAAALIDVWAELYGLHELWSIEKLHELSTRSLATLLVIRKEKMEGDGYYCEHFVTQHGVLRDLAIRQNVHDSIGQEKRLIIDISGNDLPNWWTEQKCKPKKTRLLSISTVFADGLFSGKWHNMPLPKAEVLVLNFQTNNYALPKSVKKMNKLKALIVTNYGFLPAEVRNFKLLGSLSNLKRIRLERISIPSISKNSIQLRSLQKISLFMCSIGQAFSNSSSPFLEALPSLEEMNIDYCDDLVELPAKVCDLSHLERLSITNCHKLSALPKEIGKLVNLEVLRLRSCTDLVALPDTITNLTKLNFLDISDCFSIKELPEHIGEMKGLRKINMRQCSRLQELPESVFDLLEQLEEVVCDEETHILWAPFSPASFTNLHIRVVKEEVNLHFLRQF